MVSRSKRSLFKCKKRKCEYCKKIFTRFRDLRQHQNQRKDLECFHCNNKYCNVSDLQKHLRTINKSISNIDLDNPINPSSGYEQYDAFHELLERNANKIGDRKDVYKRHKVINVQINSSTTYRDLYNLLDRIYSKSSSVFKVNLGFGYRLYNIIEEKFKYYYNSTNNLLFEHAFTISDHQSLNNFFNKITNLDLLTNYYLKNPSSSWVLAALTNVEIFIFPIYDALIGAGKDIPNYIRNNKSIKALTHHESKGFRYQDKKCFFRCLSLHQGFNVKGLERHTNKLLSQYECYTKKPLKHGVCINDLPNLEIFFHTSINVYCLQQDGVAKVIYLSRLSYKPLYLNLYNDHFSYILKFSTFAKKYDCLLCKRIFNRCSNMKNHQKDCCTEIQEVFTGGKCFNTKNIFERLKEEGIDLGDQYYKFVSCFDFESLQVPTKDEIHGRSICFEHIPASFSICSNIPNHTKPIHRISNGNPQDLVDELVKIQLEQQDAACRLMREKYSKVIEKLTNEVERFPKNGLFISKEQEFRYRKVRSLLTGLTRYCDQLIIIGFNSQKYDIPLIRQYLPSSLQRFEQLPKHVIKKGTSYMCISTKRLKYLDLSNYLAAGTSLDSLYKSYNVGTAKGTFPYQWFDSLDKLNVTVLPRRKKFHSILDNSTIDKKKYNECRKVWKQYKMKNFGDYLRFYNNSDVVGLVEAIEKMIVIENNNGLDLFKESISLPGITQRYLFKNLKHDYFVGIGQEHSYIYKDLREFGVIGGPSIIFHRMQIAGETLIKNKEVCQKIVGYDANSLYLWCMAQEMPTGFYSLREKRNNFKKSTRYSNQAIQWLSFLNQQKGIFIRHAENSIHGEVRIENYLVDGYEESCKTIYEFYGCYYHGHDCNNKFDAKKWAKTIKREENLKALGYKVVSITSCEWMKNEASKIWYSFSQLPCYYTDILQGIIDGEIFGLVKCSLHVPQELIEKYSEFPPLFKNTEIAMADIGEHMQEFCRKTKRKTCVKRALISSMFANGTIILTPLLKKYVEMGLVVTDIEFVMEFNPKRCFKWFQDEVIHDRRMADLDPNYKIRGETSKCKGNCGYGRTLMDISKHCATTFTSNENIQTHIKNPLFKTMEELNDNIFEVEKKKRKYVYNLPIQIGIAVYSYAKLSLISFWEFINKYLINDLYQIMECDTDSLYIAFARKSIDDCVKPHLKEEWKIEKYKWLSSQDTSLREFGGKVITNAQFEKRTPGLYKPEFEGLGMLCLNSKVYHAFKGTDHKTPCKDKDCHKTSCKGIQNRRNNLTREHFEEILKSQQPAFFENAGFIRDGVKTKTYTQTKKGLSYFYAKRKVLSDGVSTTHLDI